MEQEDKVKPTRQEAKKSANKRRNIEEMAVKDAEEAIGEVLKKKGKEDSNEKEEENNKIEAEK